MLSTEIANNITDQKLRKLMKKVVSDLSLQPKASANSDLNCCHRN